MSVLLGLAGRSLANRKSTVLLAVCTIAVSVLLLLAVDKLSRDARRSFYGTVSGVDLIAGPRTGALQLLLYSVFHVGDATQNLRWSSARQLAELPAVAWTVPISLGDSHAGYRVIGTTPGFFQHYQYADRRALDFTAGQPFDGLFQAVIGSAVAQARGYALGDELVLAHGVGRANLHAHEALPFRVHGVLAPTGTPLDRSVLVSLESLTAIHVGWETGMPRPGLRPDADRLAQADLTPATVTAVLIGLKNRAASFTVQRQVNQWAEEPLMAILPGATLQSLWQLVGVAENALLVVSAAVAVAGLLGMLAILLATLDQRRREMALLRSVGARPVHIFALLLIECLLLAVAGSALGVLLLWLGNAWLGPWLLASHGIVLSSALIGPLGWKVLGSVLAGALLLGILPAWAAYRRALADGLSIRL